LRLNALQNELLRQTRRRWGAEALTFLRTLAEAETRRVDEWLHRLPFCFTTLSDLIHCRPLPVRRIRHEELVRHAVAEALKCSLLVLVASPGPRLSPRGGIDYGIPWLNFIDESALVASDLVLYRSSFLAVEDPRLARALFDHLPTNKHARTKGALYSPEGHLIAGESLL
jgi:hypothetical protein